MPDTALAAAYVNDIVVTKRRHGDGQISSCLSQASIVAIQLGQLAVQLGHRVLEIGTGLSYNAAQLVDLAGRLPSSAVRQTVRAARRLAGL